MACAWAVRNCRQVGPAGRGIDPCGVQALPHRGRGDRVPEPRQLTLDPPGEGPRPGSLSPSGRLAVRGPGRHPSAYLLPRGTLPAWPSAVLGRRPPKGQANAGSDDLRISGTRQRGANARSSGCSFARSFHVLPVRTLPGCSATMSEPGRAWPSRVLTRIHRSAAVRVKANPPPSLLPCNTADRWPDSSRVTSAGPSSQMITAPVPRACPARTPSKSPAGRTWSSTGTASRRTLGSSDGPLGTAHERRTSPTWIRRSKCSVVASWSWTTKRDAVTGRPYCHAAHSTHPEAPAGGGRSEPWKQQDDRAWPRHQSALDIGRAGRRPAAGQQHRRNHGRRAEDRPGPDPRRAGRHCPRRPEVITIDLHDQGRRTIRRTTTQVRGIKAPTSPARLPMFPRQSVKHVLGLNRHGSVWEVLFDMFASREPVADASADPSGRVHADITEDGG
jgi:hypothetical protein